MVGCRQSEASDVWCCGEKGKRKRWLSGECLLTGRSVLIARFVPAVAAFGGVKLT
jgi:hypothetical protein